MKKKGIETILYSGVGIVAMLFLVIAVNLIAAQAKQRIDLTAEKAYTLSRGTRAILAKLDTPVQIRLYCTRDTKTMPVTLANYAQRVEDLLGEYKQASKGKIEVQQLDPTPDSDAEDSAKLDGVEAQPLRGGERAYLGLSVSMLDQKQAIPLLTPDRERLLEYDISRAIARVMVAKKPVVGVMSALPVMGEMNPMMMMRHEQNESRPWAFISELQRDFDVKQVELTTDKIPDEIKVMIVIHPKGISDITQFALDQFVLRGGQLVAFVDPLCALDRQEASNGGLPPPSSSTLDKLFKAWGVNFPAGQVVADLEYAASVRGERNPTILALNETAMNKDDVLTADADNVLMVFSGVFTGTPAAGLTKTDLIKTTTRSQLVDSMMASFGATQIANDFKASGTQYPLAIRLAGRFKTAFPEGKPKPAQGEPAQPKPTEKPGDANFLKESTHPTTVVLAGDADMIQNAVAVRELQTLGGQPLVIPVNGNLGFAQGAVEQLAGDSDLIAVRSRASRERPFTVVQKMQADAETNYRSKIKELETSLADTQRKMNELQRSKDAGQRFILSPEQQEELTNFRKTEADVKAQLKEMRRKLRAQIDSLENRIKWINIAGIPVAVILVGFLLAALKRQRAGE
jgi:ABC-type uncharacterized transport system involved in gliding motility auxiliary subunit